MSERSERDEPVAGSGPERTERFWAVGFPLLSALLALAVPALLLTGRNAMLNTTGGAVEGQVTDPAAAGWRAWSEPTPTALVLQREDDGRLVGATLIALTGRDSGALVPVPVGTAVAGPAGGGRTLAAVAVEGEEAVRAAVEDLLGLAPTDVVTLDADGWRRAVAGTAPLTVENPDDIYVAGDERPVLRFAKGALSLAEAEVAEYLALRNPGEVDVNRLVRHEVLWRAWVAAVARGGAGAGPEGPLGRYVTALAAVPDGAGRLAVTTLPVQVEPGEVSPGRLVPVTDQVTALVTRVVPFPVSSAGRRVRIRLLDGVGTLQHGVPAAGRLVGRGGQIDQIGNAAAFGVPRTKLEYTDDRRRQEAEALVAGLGVGEVVKATDSDGSVDVVVTLGRDYADGPGRQGG